MNSRKIFFRNDGRPCPPCFSNRDLWSVDPKTHALKQITSNATSESDPAVSPDGKKLAYTSTQDGNPEIYVIPVGGGTPKRLTTNAAIDALPTSITVS